MSEPKLSEFLAEHRASEFGLAPVSKAMERAWAKIDEKLTDWGVDLPDIEEAIAVAAAEEKVS